jgi:hypothetical protein
MVRIACAVALILGAGGIHGAWTNRWRPSTALALSASRLQEVPAKVGDWSAQEVEIGARELQLAGAVGSLSRRYVNARTGESLSVMLLCGLPANIGSHSPEVCYPGAGFVLEPATRVSFPIGTPPRSVTLQTATARKDDPVRPGRLRIFWGWNNAKGWDAPDDPRWSYAALPALWKLYVIRELSGADVEPADDPCREFLDRFLPELDHTLFAPAAPTSPASR